MTSKRRRLAAKSIADLEALHANSSSDPATRDMLREELSHRSTERARKLRERLGAPVAAKPVQPPVTAQPAPAAARFSFRVPDFVKVLKRTSAPCGASASNRRIGLVRNSTILITHHNRVVW